MTILVTSEPCRLARPYLGGQSFFTITINRPKGIMPGIVGHVAQREEAPWKAPPLAPGSAFQA